MNLPTTELLQRYSALEQKHVMTNELTHLRDAIRRFAEERDWDQFHSPKNLAMALSVEAAELLEHFQWLKQEESKQLAPDKKKKVAMELADVFIYLVRIADKLNIDLIAAANEKIVANGQKYPVEKSKGNIKKYTDL